MTQSKAGIALPAAPAVCKSPVTAQFNLGEKIEVRGTPAVFTVDGLQLGGYVPPDELAKSLGIRWFSCISSRPPGLTKPGAGHNVARFLFIHWPTSLCQPVAAEPGVNPGPARVKSG